MSNALAPKIPVDEDGNVTVTTTTELTGIAMMVSPLGESNVGRRAPIKMNGSVTFRLDPGTWVFTVKFQNVDAEAKLSISVDTPHERPMIPEGPLNASEPRYQHGRLPIVVNV